MTHHNFSTTSSPKPTGIIVLEDGSVFYGHGFGSPTTNVGEICFNTSITGYQEILTDPSYAGQIITFTFPHIGNVGTNDADMETLPDIKLASRGLIVRQDLTQNSNWRAELELQGWLEKHDLPGVCGIDTRALTRRIRDKGAPKGIIAYNEKGEFDIDALTKMAQDWSGLEGLDLAKEVSTKNTYEWNEECWSWANGFKGDGEDTLKDMHIVAIDYGAKVNILRCLASCGAKVTVVPAQTSAYDILALSPDGVFLSNGPGDPSATGVYAIPVIQSLLDKDIPIFGICLGHQLLCLALGGTTQKMHLGHRGANHPVKDLASDKVEITSQNHGFCVVQDSLPSNVEATHISLFDGSNEGIKHKTKKAFSVQYHPEASPGPQDSLYLFERFAEMIRRSA